jgi:hypothetical protein
MNTKLNSVSSAETKDERTTNDDVASTVHHHNSNTIVACSFNEFDERICQDDYHRNIVNQLNKKFSVDNSAKL